MITDMIDNNYNIKLKKNDLNETRALQRTWYVFLKFDTKPKTWKNVNEPNIRLLANES